ncbi:hypothetical protein QU839_24910, partial [Escherichia coli]|nr:hypothetical protein [Escherichia coli]
NVVCSYFHVAINVRPFVRAVHPVATFITLPFVLGLILLKPKLFLFHQHEIDKTNILVLKY